MISTFAMVLHLHLDATANQVFENRFQLRSSTPSINCPFAKLHASRQCEIRACFYKPSGTLRPFTS
jgi:hypothetical protein